MEKISRQISATVVGEYDVVVCGGGPSGFVAAVAAARSGASVAIIERYGFLGGMATAGMVAPITEFMHEGELISGGIPLEFVTRMEKMGYGKMCAPRGNYVFHPEIYKLVSQRMVLEEGIDLYLHAYISDCVVTDGNISHIIFESKSGTSALKTKYVIDATGDGDIAYRAGVPMLDYNAPLQPASLYFALANVKTDMIPGYYPGQKSSSMKNVHETLNKLRETEDIPQFGGPWCFAGMGDGIGVINMARTAVDWTDEKAASEAECLLHESVDKLVKVLRENFEEFSDAYLLMTAPQIGIRETRHIKGVHVLTGEEYVNSVFFDDSVAKCAHPIDIHDTANNSQICRYLEKPAYLPYRSIISDGFNNLLVPSRCFSADREAFASARVQVGVMGLGQAAGVAAALCCKKNLDVKNVDINELRRILIDWGMPIEK